MTCTDTYITIGVLHMNLLGDRRWAQAILVRSPERVDGEALRFELTLANHLRQAGAETAAELVLFGQYPQGLASIHELPQLVERWLTETGAFINGEPAVGLVAELVGETV